MYNLRMARLLVYTLGFDEKFAIRAFTRHDLNIGDKVLLITARPVVERVEKAYLTLEEFIRKYYQGKIDLELFPVNLSSFIDAVCTIKDRFIREFSNNIFDRIIINLTGGLRVLVLSTFTALLFLPENITKHKYIHIEVEFEDSSRLIEIPSQIIHIITFANTLTDEKKKVLRFLLEKGKSTIPDISASLALDPSTVRRHIYDLNEMGLVDIERERPLKVKARDISRLLL